MRRSPVLLAVLATACQDAGPQYGSVQQEIVGGVADHDDPGVVAIELLSGSGWAMGLCSGTLITPRVVLTAAHCVDPTAGASAYRVYFGSNVFGYDAYALGTRDGIAWEWHPSWDPAHIEYGYDIGLILLDEVGPTPPLSINRDDLADHVGDPIRLVGFGDTFGGAGDAGLKRQVTSAVSDVYLSMVLFGSYDANTCQGDSGGPNFMTIGGKEVVAGVTSFGDEACRELGGSTRVDFYTLWIDAWVREHDPNVTCAADGGCDTGCAEPDPDCPCGQDGYCISACSNPDMDLDCYACGGGDECILGCSPPDVDCGALDPCDLEGTCVADCVPHDPDCPPAATGAPCSISDDCASGLCLQAADEPDIHYCTADCGGSLPACPDGMVCGPVSDRYVCFWEAPTPGAFGGACTTNESCLSGLCVDLPDRRACSVTCDTTPCPSGWECEAQATGSSICLAPESERPVCGVAGSGGTGPAGLALLVAATALALTRTRRRRRP